LTERQRQQVRESLSNLRKKIAYYRKSEMQLGEQNTKALLIDPLLAGLGWDIQDPEEVTREFRRQAADSPVDYALCIARTPRLFVEANSLGKNLTDRKWASQVLNYANVVGVEWCVLTNGPPNGHHRTVTDRARGDAASPCGPPEPLPSKFNGSCRRTSVSLSLTSPHQRTTEEGLREERSFILWLALVQPPLPITRAACIDREDTDGEFPPEFVRREVTRTASLPQADFEGRNDVVEGIAGRRSADHPSITTLQSLFFPSWRFAFGVVSLPRGLIVGSASLQSPHAPP